MPVFHNILYYFNKQEKSLYSNRPQGILDINRLIKNLPPWKKDLFSKLLKKKSLIIADWTAFSWSEEKICQVEKLLSELLTEGFPLYLWQNGHIRPLTKEFITRLRGEDIRKDITLEYPDNISHKAITEHHLTKDQVSVLNDYWIDFLLSGDTELPPRSIDTDMIDKYLSYPKHHIPGGKFYSILKQLSPPLKKIIHTKFNAYTNLQYHEITRAFPNIKPSIIPKYIYIGHEDVSSFLEKNFIPHHQLTLNSSELSLVNYIRAPINSVKELAGILDKFTHLDGIELYFYDKSLPLEGLSKCKEIILSNSYSSISSKHVESLRNAERLKTLNISTLSGTINTSFNLPSLESLHIGFSYDSTTTLQDISYLLKASSSLKSLSLHTIADSKNDLSFNLPSLEMLNLNFSKVSDKRLKDLLQHTRSLKSINITNCPNITNFYSISLEGLENLYLDNTVFTSKAIEDVLCRAQKLQSLSLSYLPENLCSSQLCKLHLKQGAFSNTSLKKIELPSLTSLKIEECEGLDKLPKKLFTSIPSLVNLELNTIEHYRLDDLLPTESNFPNLKSVDLYSVYIHNLQSFLSKVSTIEYLSLGDSHFDNITGDICLPYLRKLDLASQTQLSPHHLKILLRAAPALEILHLEKHPSLFNDPELMELVEKVKDVYWRKPEPEPEPDTRVNLAKPLPRVKNDRHMDADTKYVHHTYHLSRIFFPLNKTDSLPPVSTYRFEVFNTLIPNQSACSAEAAFQLKNEGEANFTKPRIKKISTQKELVTIGENLSKKEKNVSYFFAQEQFQLSSEWQALPSLSPAEEMTHYFIEPQKKVEICHSERDNLYYIRSTSSPIVVNLSFLVKIHTTTHTPPLPESIKELIDEISHYTSDELNLSQYPNPTGEDYLDALLSQKKGACRHRAVAFKKKMEKKHPTIPVRIIWNACHAFAEININKQWIRVDLGGYACNLSINESRKPDKENLEPPSPAQEIINAPKGFNDDLLATWKKQKKTISSILEYSQHLMQPSEKNKARLVELPSTAILQELRLSLENYCHRISRPCFYIHSPSDLSCFEPFVKRDGNHGELTPGPGGPLYNFLTQSYTKDNPPVLLVNYDNFDADDIVRFNALLDQKPIADGINLPEASLVVGLINTTKPDCYQGSDFYSRFTEVEKPTLNLQILSDHVKSLTSFPIENKRDNKESYLINLFNSSMWKEVLLGYWEMQGDRLCFVEGALESALASGLTVEISNGLWQDEEFELFWKEASVKGYIEHNGHRISLPKEFKLIKSEGYDWEKLRGSLCFVQGFIEEGLTLNPSELSHFFKRYTCKENKLYTEAGYIKEHTQKELHVNLTGDLSEEEWAMLLTDCERHKVRLQVHCNHVLSLPPGLTPSFNFPKKLEPEARLPLAIVSTDIDTTLAQLSNQGYDLIIDITECKAEDLIKHTSYHVDKKTGKTSFYQNEQALLKALQQGKRVILKGRFSEELVDSLAPLLLSNLGKNITLLSEEDAFPYLPTKQCIVSTKEKIDALKEEFSEIEIKQLSENWFEKESLSQLKARLYFLKAFPQENSEDAWLGLEKLTTHYVWDKDDCDHTRLTKLKKILDYSPYVFLTGLTGVGKSTFIKKNIPSLADTTFYSGEEKMTEWAEDLEDKCKILFIDEANLSPNQWSMFEGLYHHPPGILIKGNYYPLTKHHKVIFAGNPLNYGGERQLASFFKRHGNVLLFNPLSPDFIYENMLKPLFADNPLFTQVESLCAPFLEVYRFLCECSTETVLISPREPQMMALLTLSYASTHPDQDLTKIAQHYAFYLAEHLVPTAFRERFEKKFKPSEPLPEENLPPLKGFINTPSRQPLSQWLCELMKLREIRQQSSNESIRFGGLGGLIIEGQSGLGKSHLVSELIHDGLGIEACHIPVSWTIEKKKEALLDAFNKGLVVIIDEINSSPLMERLLNDLLMGYYPETKIRPEKAGFFVIATQNPVTMAGRCAISPALSHRLITTTLSPYPREEMINIVNSKGLSKDKAILLVDSYERNLRLARKEHLTPEPTFRDLLRVAEDMINSHSKATESSIKKNNLELSPREQAISDLIALLEWYLEGRRAVTETVQGKERTKEYFYPKFFPCFQKNFTQKEAAVKTLIAVLKADRDAMDLDDEHLATLRDGNLGRLFRDFIKHRKADPIFQDAKVNTVREFLTELKKPPYDSYPHQ